MISLNYKYLMFFSKGNEKNFKLVNFLISTISFGVLHTSLICCVLVQYFKDSGMLPLQISIIMVSKRVLRLFCDGFFGLMFDRFGAKVVFFIGRLLKLISYLILLNFSNFYGFVIAMLLDGASYSSIYGKINSFIYNNLSIRGKLFFFQKAVSMYYLCINITISMMTFFAGILLKYYGYNIIIYISIFTNIFSIFILIKYVPSYKDEMQTFRSKSIKNIFLSLRDSFVKNKQFSHLICFYAVMSFMAWQFHGISSLVLLDMGFTSVNLAMCGSLLKLTMAIGAIVSIVFFSKGLKLEKCAMFLLCIICFGLISSAIYNPYVFYVFCLFIAIAYTTIEVSIEKNFEYYSDKTIRGTSISLAMTICSIFAMVSHLFVGLIAQYFNYKLGIIILLTMLFFVVFYLTIKFHKIDYIKSNV